MLPACSTGLDHKVSNGVCWRCGLVLVDFPQPPRYRNNRPKPSTILRVFKRDNYTCQYCGDRPGEDRVVADHIVPRSKGGGNGERNLATACQVCDKEKRDRLVNIVKLRASPGLGFKAYLLTDQE